MSDVHVVLPNDIDDRRRPSGGNVYDRRICTGLAVRGWAVHEHPVSGAWPLPEAGERLDAARVLGGLPRGAITVVDGLVAAGADTGMLAATSGLRLVVLVHMPTGDSPAFGSGSLPAARELLTAASAVVTTSRWSRQEVRSQHSLPGGHVHVIEPGITPVDIATGTPSGGELLCVAAVTPQKGHDVLVDALAMVSDLSWHCVCAGSAEVRPDFAAHVRERAAAAGVDDRMHLVGPLAGSALSAAYMRADLLVLPTRVEAYGMVVAEALAHGLPVVASRVGGIPEALGSSPGFGLPGVLTPVDDPRTLASELRRWLTDAGHRQRVRTAARTRRSSLVPWSRTAERWSRLLAALDEPCVAVHRTTG